MEANELFEQLNNQAEPAAHRQVLVAHLRDQANTLRQQPDRTIDIAYSIAGIMATDYARSLNDNDPISEILTIAGELESNPTDAAQLKNELLTAADRLA